MNEGLKKWCSRFQKEKWSKGIDVYLEDCVMWYCLQDVEWYLSLSIHERINHKQSYFDIADGI